MPCRECLIFALFLVLSTKSVGSRHLSQFADRTTSSLPTGWKRLTEEDNLKGALKENEMPFVFSVVRQNTTFPDILLSLDVVNPAANADIFCAPFNVSDPRLRSHWKSQNAQGNDYVFISTNSPYYAYAITNNVKGVAEFECILKHVSYEDPIYLIDMDVSYTKRRMRDEEQEAMKEIYDMCCQAEGSCVGWNEQMHSVEHETKTARRKVVDFDFCHVASNVCDKDGYMLKLTMDRFGLECPFPTEQISKFERLQKLSMTGNALGGNILDIAQSFKNMEYLDEVALSYNRLSGAMGKEIEDSTQNPLCTIVRRGLEHLHLENNDINGPLPECLFSEGSSLRDLVLDNNPISGSIPDTIAKDSPLEMLSVRDGNLTGVFPETFVHADNLVFLQLSNNQMKGELPDAFGPAPKLKNLLMSGNAFTGKIPAGIAASKTLESIFLDHNAFTSMPDQWQNEGPKTPLANLDISFNKIDEDFPAALALVHNLSRLYMNDNKFRGPLPDLPNMFPYAWVLNLSNNAFTGNIPLQWTKIGMFQETAKELEYRTPVLDLSYNNLVGKVPDFFFDTANFPKRLLESVTVNFEGNSFICPKMGTTVHLNGFEHCPESKNPVFGESHFDVSRNGAQPVPFGADTVDKKQETSATDEADQELQLSSSTDASSSSSSSNSDTWIIVISITGAAILVSVVIALTLRVRMYHLAKKAMGAPPSDVEIEAVRHEPLESSKELEEARLRAGTQNSDSNPL